MIKAQHKTLVFLILLIGRDAFCQQFAEQTLSGYNLYTVSFSDSLNGWIGGYPNLLMYTSDGGRNWAKDSLSYASAGKARFFWVRSTSPKNVWLVWWDEISRVGRQNSDRTKWDILLLGDDGGHICESGWSIVAPLDTSRAWACGWASTLCGATPPFQKSTDGGKTWQHAGLSLRNYIGPGGNNYFADLEVTSNFVFVLNAGRIVHRVQVDSIVWQADTVSQISNYYADLSFAGSNYGWVCGMSGNLLRTTNAGDSWLPQHISTTQNLSTICAIDSEFAWALGDSGAVFRTTNGGISWDSVLSVRPFASALSFPDRNHGWIVGFNGEIVQYNSGVITGFRNAEAIACSIELFQNHPNPFNSSTAISFELSHSSYVTVKIFNILGKEVTTIIEGELLAGMHLSKWDASNFSTGVYWCRARVGDMSQTIKLILLR